MIERKQLLGSLAEDGYALLPGLVAGDWCARLRAEAARFSGDHPLSVQVQLVNRSAAIREFVTSGPQVAVAVAVLGENVCFTHQQYIIKNPDRQVRSSVPWHQDNGYGRLEPPRDLTVWLALDDCDEDNGCLWVLPGSHKNGLQDHEPAGGLRTTAVADTGVALPMKAGDAVCFGSLLLHRSLPNRTDAARCAMYVRYCDPAVVMVSEGHRPVLEDRYSWMVAGEAPS